MKGAASGRRAAGGGRDRGFALLIVLWAVVLLALLATRLMAAGRTELQLSANLRGAAEAEAAADGAVQEAMFHLLNPSDAWRADGADRPTGPCFRRTSNARRHRARMSDAATVPILGQRRATQGLQIISASLSPVWLLGPREHRSKSWPGRLDGLR